MSLLRKNRPAYCTFSTYNLYVNQPLCTDCTLVLFIVRFENFRVYVRDHVGSKTETIFFHHHVYLELPNFAGSRSAIGSFFALRFKAAIRLVNIGKCENMASKKQTDSSPIYKQKLRADYTQEFKYITESNKGECHAFCTLCYLHFSIASSGKFDKRHEQSSGTD